MELAYVIGIGLLLLLIIQSSDSLPQKYRKRDCMGKSWISRFPDADKEDIRRFLVTFTDAFAFSSDDKLKFEPNDKLLDIYRQLYPSRLTPDAMEFETLADDLNEKYHFKLSELWHDDLTLGELYSGVRNT